MKTALPVAALGAALLVCGCTSHGGGLDSARFNSPDFGASVRSNIAAESVPADPDAVNSTVDSEGARQSLAQSRYNTDRVKQPPDPNTSTVNTGSSSGSGSGASGGAGSSSGTSPY